VKVAEEWLAGGVFLDVTGGAGFTDKDGARYRLQASVPTGALNTVLVWRDPADAPMAVAGRLTRLLADAVAPHRDADGLVDYSALHRSDAFLDFQVATCELQAVDFASLSPAARTAFCLNLYNILVVHAYGEVGVPKSIAGFYPSIRYHIQGHLYSCDDLEHGVLRANRPSPSGPDPLFGPDDPRRPNALPAVDHRIHFALNCGARSCPPVKYYNAERVDEELELAAQAFLEQPTSLAVSLDPPVLRLSRLLLWYARDFGDDDREVAETLLQHLRGAKRAALETLVRRPFTVEHFDYDWTTDAKTSPPYRQPGPAVSPT